LTKTSNVFATIATHKQTKQIFLPLIVDSAHLKSDGRLTMSESAAMHKVHAMLIIPYYHIYHYTLYLIL